jgi:uncharacterized protein YdeI (YjbR/CyaY-like superfamily)
MGTHDSRVDAYIAKSAAFARPILERLRTLVHEALPAVEEDMKWGAPHFMHRGMLAGMAAFKQHVGFGFWQGERVTGAKGTTEAMGQFGRIASLGDLPPAAKLRAWVKRAAALNESGEKRPRPLRHPRPTLAVTPELAAALAKHAKARATFDAFSPSHRREYIEWIAEAKTDATRAERLEKTIAQLAEGKTRHWKYQRPAAKATRKQVAAKNGRKNATATKPAPSPATKRAPARRSARGLATRPRSART